MKRILVDVDKNLHREFKTYCYSTGQTMREVIIAFMESKTKKKGGIKKKKQFQLAGDAEAITSTNPWPIMHQEHMNG